MFTQQKIAAVSGLLGGLAAICTGTTAYAAAPAHCTTDSHGAVTCVQSSDVTYTSKDGTQHVHQKQDCTTVSRNRLEQPVSALGQLGTTHVGPVVNCSNHAPAPKNFTLPAILR